MSTKYINYINSGRRIGLRPQQRDDPDIITEKSGAVISGCVPSPLGLGFRVQELGEGRRRLLMLQTENEAALQLSSNPTTNRSGWKDEAAPEKAV